MITSVKTGSELRARLEKDCKENAMGQITAVLLGSNSRSLRPHRFIKAVTLKPMAEPWRVQLRGSPESTL